MKLLFKILKKHILQILLLIVSVCVQVFMQVVIMGSISNAVSIAMSSVENSKVSENILPITTLVNSGVLLIILDIVACIFSLLTGYICANLSSKVGYELRKNIYEKIINFSMPEFDKYSTSTLINRSTNDVKVVQDTLYMFLYGAFQAPLYAIIGIVFITKYKSNMEYIVYGLVIVVVVVIYILFMAVLKFASKMQESLDNLNKVTRESLKGIKDIRAYTMEEWSFNRNKLVNDTLRKIGIKYNSSIHLFMPVMNFCWDISATLIIFFGVNKVLSNVITIGSLLAFSSYASVIVMGFLLLATLFIQLPRAVASMNRISEVLNENATIVNGTQHIDKIKNIKFSNVKFKYHKNGGYILNDINMDIKSGSTVAFIGETGSGKSTVLKLIERFYDVFEGDIFINDKNIKEYDTNELRKHIGYVPQKVKLFTESISDNISFSFDENENREKLNKNIENAAKLSMSEEFILAKKEKYDTLLTGGASNLSGGQRQRLSIARVMMGNKDIYMFDDSFSALDSLTTKKVKENIKTIAKDSIVIFVAQRISQISDSDVIVVFDNGKISGIGCHEDLLNTNIVYKEIFESQK